MTRTLVVIFWLVSTAATLAQSLPFPGPGRASHVTITYTDNGLIGPSCTTCNYSSIAIGTAASERYVVVGAGGRSNSSTIAVSSMTVGGVAASRVAAQQSGVFDTAELWIAKVPTGTTATISVTWNMSVTRSNIAVWAIYNPRRATAISTGTSTANPQVLSMSAVPAGAAMIGFASVAAGTTFTWSGLSKDVDTNNGGSFTTGGASAMATTSGTQTITATPGAGTEQAGVSAAFY